LDIGSPVINGKIDTLTQGMNSANNSMLLSQMSGNGSNANLGGSNSGSLSHFAKNNLPLDSKKNAHRGSFRAHGTGGQSFLKAAIFRNMQKNSEYMEEYKESGSPVSRKLEDQQVQPRERRFSENLGYVGHDGAFRNNSHSPESGDYGDEISNENPQVQLNVEKMKTGTPDKHPSKMLNQSKKKLIFKPVWLWNSIEMTIHIILFF